MKELKIKIILVVLFLIANLIWALVYFKNQSQVMAVRQLQDIVQKCHEDGGDTILKPNDEGFDGACVYMQIRFGDDLKLEEVSND